MAVFCGFLVILFLVASTSSKTDHDADEVDATDVHNATDIPVIPSINLKLPQTQAPVVVKVNTAKLENTSEPLKKEIEAIVLDAIVDAGNKIVPTPVDKKARINGFTFRLFSTIDSSKDVENGLSSLRTKVTTQTTTTFFTTTQSAGASDLSAPVTVDIVLEPDTRDVVTQYTFTTTKHDDIITVKVTKFSPSPGPDHWTQSVENTEFKWSRTVSPTDVAASS